MLTSIYGITINLADADKSIESWYYATLTANPLTAI